MGSCNTSTVATAAPFVGAAAGAFHLVGKLAAQFIAHERPHLGHCVLPCDVAANLRIEVFRAGTGRFTGDGEAVFEHQDAERQQAQRGRNRPVRMPLVKFQSGHCTINTMLRSELVFA